MMMKTRLSMVGVCLTMACSVPGKSVGIESDDADGDAGGDAGSTGDGGTDGGQSESDGADDGPGDDGPGDEGPSDDGPGDDGSCPPVDPNAPQCATCTLAPDCTVLCDFSDCNVDCAGDMCGEPCVVCPADDNCAEVFEGWSAGVCDPSGVCVDEDEPDPCDTGLQAGFEDDFTQQIGCADIVLAARSADDTLALVVELPDWGVAEVVEETEWLDLAYDAADTFEVRVGSHVTEFVCNDALSNEPVIDATWTAVAGTLHVTVTPGEGGGLPQATVELVDVTLQDGEGNSVGLASYTFEAIGVGWLPG